jgi:uncharacterized coiled-coil DUF342 family protein
MDRTRKYDLEQLSEMLKDPRTSPRARREIEETMHKIINTSAPIRSLREELVNATRGGDVLRIRKIQQHIQAIRMDETNGKEF